MQTYQIFSFSLLSFFSSFIWAAVLLRSLAVAMLIHGWRTVPFFDYTTRYTHTWGLLLPTLFSVYFHFNNVWLSGIGLKALPSRRAICPYTRKLSLRFPLKAKNVNICNAPSFFLWNRVEKQTYSFRGIVYVYRKVRKLTETPSLTIINAHF